MNMKEFAVAAQRRRELAPLWHKLHKEAHRLISSRLRVEFLGHHTVVPDTEFLAAKRELEAACEALGMETPDLSLRAFVNTILRY